MSRLESVYLRLPPWLQNAAISLYGLSYRHERLGGGYKKYIEKFVERDHWPSERMRDYLNAQLQSLLVHAFRNVPYYRAKCTSEGISKADLARFTLEDLKQLPIVPKIDLRNNPDAFVAE